MKQTKKIIFSLFLLLGITFSGNIFASNGQEVFDENYTPPPATQETEPPKKKTSSVFDVHGQIIQKTTSKNIDTFKFLEGIEIQQLDVSNRQVIGPVIKSDTNGKFTFTVDETFIDEEQKKALILIKHKNNYYLKKIINVADIITQKKSQKDSAKNNVETNKKIESTKKEIQETNISINKELEKLISFNVFSENDDISFLSPSDRAQALGAQNKSKDLKQKLASLKLTLAEQQKKSNSYNPNNNPSLGEIFLTPNPNNPIPTSAKHLTLEGTGFDGLLKDNIFVKAGGGFDGYKKGEAGNEDRLLKNFFSGDNGILTIILQILGTIGILYFIIGGIRYIFSNGDDENKEKAKNQILWGAIGLVILSMAEFVGFEFINPYENDILEDGFANTWHTKVNQMIRIIEYIVGGLFLLNGTVSAYNLATSRGQSDTLESEKTFIQTFIWGFAFILLAETIVRIVTLDSRADQQAVIFDEVGGIINFILSFFAGAAALMIILSALYYTISFGNDEQVEKAKSILKYSAIAFVVAFSSYVIAQFIIV